MHTGWRGGLAAALAMVAVTGLAAGCDNEKSNKESASADAGANDGPAQPVIGGKLGAAVAAAASGSAAPRGVERAGAAGSDGPPESGVFAPGGAAVALPKDTPYKIEVISDGSEPRAKLASQLDVKAEQKLNVNLGVRMGGPQGLPNLDLGLTFKVEKAKDAGETPKEGAAAPQAKPSGATVTVKIASATLASMSLGGPPKELADVLGKLKGSSIRYALSPENVAGDFKVELAKGADPGLETVLSALGEAIGLLTPALPDKPVGVGAYWMITDRSIVSGARLPVLRYRVFKLEKVDGNLVSLSLDSRQYAEGPEMKLPSASKEVILTLDRFDSQGKGTLAWSPATPAPPTADVTHRFQGMLIPPGGNPQSQQRSVAQMELSAKLSAPPAP